LLVQAPNQVQLGMVPRDGERSQLSREGLLQTTTVEGLLFCYRGPSSTPNNQCIPPPNLAVSMRSSLRGLWPHAV